MTHIKVGKAATSVGAEGVVASNIGAEAVTAAKIQAPAALPVAGAKAKGEQVTAAVSAVKKQVVMLCASTTEKAYKVTHGLGEAVAALDIIKVSTKASVAGKILKWESATKTEIEIEATVADKEEFYIVLSI